MSEKRVTIVQPNDDFVCVVVQVANLHDEETGIMQREVLAAAAERPGLPVALDLSQVTFFPSLSLGAVVTILQEMKKQKRKLVLLGVQPPVRGTLAVTRLDRLFEIHDTLEHALAQLRTGGAGATG